MRVKSSQVSSPSILRPYPPTWTKDAVITEDMELAPAELNSPSSFLVLYFDDLHRPREVFIEAATDSRRSKTGLSPSSISTLDNCQVELSSPEHTHPRLRQVAIGLQGLPSSVQASKVSFWAFTATCMQHGIRIGSDGLDTFVPRWCRAAAASFVSTRVLATAIRRRFRGFFSYTCT